MIILARDTTTGAAAGNGACEQSRKSVPVHFRVTDIGLGEVAAATDHFVSP